MACGAWTGCCPASSAKSSPASSTAAPAPSTNQTGPKPTRTAHRSRTAAQRRADALVELALHASVNEDGATINRPAVTAVIHVDQITDPATQPGDPVGRSEHGQPVTKTTAERLLCDCAMSRVVLDANSRPRRPGHDRPAPFSRHNARALAARDGGCTFPGCDRPPGWTSAHHLVHWIKDGPTDLANLTLLCTFHHHRVHEGGYESERMPDGQLEFRRPDDTPSPSPNNVTRCDRAGRYKSPYCCFAMSSTVGDAVSPCPSLVAIITE